MVQFGICRSSLFPSTLAIAFFSFFSSLPVIAQAKNQPCGSACVVNKYVGAGSCGASACHGAPHPRCDNRVLLNEYRTWFLNDPHFKAAAILETPSSSANQQEPPPGSLLESQMRSQQIIKNLNEHRPTGQQIDPAKPRECLVCHGLAPAKEERERDFGIEGVGCEICHGPASGWLEPHIREPRKDWTPAKYVSLGMYNYTNISLYAKECLSCHLGGDKPNQEVNHEMIAAGHPDLLFELDLFSAKQPAHWQRPEPSGGVRLWAIGQAVQLREALGRLQRRADRGNWPEYSELDCFSCHHSLGPLNKSWRQQRKFDMRGAGVPGWNDAHYLMFGVLLEQNMVADNKLVADLKGALKEVITATNTREPKPVAASAAKAYQLADTYVNKLENVDKSRFDKTLAANLLRGISGNGSNISDDTRSAEQAWMALDTLYRYYEAYTRPRQTVKNNPNGLCVDQKIQNQQTPVSAELEKLFKEFDDPSAFSRPRFISQMQQVNNALQQESKGK